ncbi:MAG: hypothetical protein ABIH42_00920 [Planctomycetota bacterium]
MMMKSLKKKNKVIAFLILFLLISSCKSIPWDNFLPRDVFPSYAVARLKGALLMGYYRDSYDSLSKKTQEQISYLQWRFGTILEKVEGCCIYDIITECKIIGELKDDSNHNTVLVIAEYKNWGGSIPVIQEDGSWKVGLYEFLTAENSGIEP